MKNIRQLYVIVVLTCVLTLSASAGQMTTGIVDPPPPSSSAMADGQMTTGSSEAVDPVTQVALSLLQSVISLF